MPRVRVTRHVSGAAAERRGAAPHAPCHMPFFMCHVFLSRATCQVLRLSGVVLLGGGAVAALAAALPGLRSLSLQVGRGGEVCT